MSAPDHPINAGDRVESPKPLIEFCAVDGCLTRARHFIEGCGYRIGLCEKHVLSGGTVTLPLNFSRLGERCGAQAAKAALAMGAVALRSSDPPAPQKEE